MQVCTRLCNATSKMWWQALLQCSDCFMSSIKLNWLSFAGAPPAATTILLLGTVMQGITLHQHSCEMQTPSHDWPAGGMKWH